MNMAVSTLPEITNKKWTLVSPIGDGVKAWNSAKTEMLCTATWNPTSSMYVVMNLTIPKIPLQAGKTTVFQVGDRYNTASQMHFQVNITYNSAGELTGVTPILYEGASEKAPVAYRFYYR